MMKNKISGFIITLICLTLINVNAQTITNFTTDNGLPHNSVNSVAVDSDDNPWFGTQAGVAMFDQGSWTYYTTSDGLIDNVIKCIALDDQDNVWVGTDFGVSTFDGMNWTTYTTEDGLGNNWIYYINIDQDGNVWFGTIIGLSKFDTEGSWTNYGIAEGLTSGVCFITFDEEGNKWLGTFTGGMVKFNDSEFVAFTTDDGLLNNFNICSIAIDDQNHKWVATPLGMSQFDQNDQWVANWQVDDGLYTEAIKDIDIDSQGNLWIGNYTDYLNQGAVNKYDGSTWEYFVVDKDDIIDSLISIVIRRLAIDSQDNVWVATGNGVSKISNESSGISNTEPQIITMLFPNPARDVLNIEILHTSTKSRSIEIFNIGMQKTGDFRLPANTYTLRIPLAAFPPGIYFVKLENHVSKFIIQ